MEHGPQPMTDFSMPGVVAEMISPDTLRFRPEIVVPVSAATVSAVIALGCVALMMLGIQPLVLGGLQTAGRISVPAMGQAATMETLALGVVSATMAARIRHNRLRLWGLAGLLLLILANVVGLFADGFGFVVSRGLAGTASGILVWIAVGLITHHPNAGRVNAMFIGAQALSQGAVAALTPIILSPVLGADSGLWVLGGSAALALLLLGLIPRELHIRIELHEHAAEAKQPAGLHLSSLAALAANLLMMAGIVGLWVYIEPLARGLHLSERVLSFSVAGSLGAQVVGAATMAAFERRVNPITGLFCVTAAFVGATAAFAWLPSQAAFISTTLAFGFLWTSALALGFPLLIAADRTRRAPMYGPAAVLLGSSLGPLVAGAFATDTNIKPALVVSATFFVLTAVAVAVCAQTRPQSR